MTAIILTNAVLAALILAGVVSLLAAGIVTAPFDRGVTLVRRRRRQLAPARLSPAI